MVQVTCYGGVGQIGGNQFLLEDGGTRLFFDFGTPFAQRGRFYEEYLNPRSAFGLLDPLAMGLLPSLRGLYRPDMEQADARLWDQFEDSPAYRDLRGAEVHGVLLSHAHLDHCGYLSFVREEVAVYTTALTALVAKAVQDSGKSDFEREVTYTVPKELTEAGLLEAGNYRRVAARQRPFRLFDHGSLSPEAHAFWADTPGSRALEAVALEAAHEIGGLEVRCFSVDHSIPGACAFAVRTSAGWVGYTGDLRLHGAQGERTRRFVEGLKALKPVALLCEGTRADPVREGEPNYSERDVRERALREVQQARGLVIADFGPRNVERLLIFADIARETGRALVLLSKDAYLLKAVDLADPGFPSVLDIPDLYVYDEPKVQRQRWEQAIRKDYAARLIAPAHISQHQDQYILCFSFFDLNELPSIRPRPGSLYLYSSHEAFDEEIRLDFKRLRAWLDFFEMRHVGLPLEELDWRVPAGEEGLHASGHADGPALVSLIEEVGPMVLVPIHAEQKGIDYFQQKLSPATTAVKAPSYGQPIPLG